MDNGERGRRLMQDMDAATGRQSWNAVVRRAQEVVELALKGVLSYLGVDFPKVHDPAAVFIATLSARGMALSATEAEDVTNVSATLARKRSPAFYFEQIEDESTAQEATAIACRDSSASSGLPSASLRNWMLPRRSTSCASRPETGLKRYAATVAAHTASGSTTNGGCASALWRETPTTWKSSITTDTV